MSEAAPAPFLTTQELAARRRVSIRTVERWRSDGSGPPFQRRGQLVLYPIDKVQAWEQAGEFSSIAHERAAQLSTGANGKDDCGKGEGAAVG